MGAWDALWDEACGAGAAAGAARPAAAGGGPRDPWGGLVLRRQSPQEAVFITEHLVC